MLLNQQERTVYNINIYSLELVTAVVVVVEVVPVVVVVSEQWCLRVTPTAR